MNKIEPISCRGSVLPLLGTIFLLLFPVFFASCGSDEPDDRDNKPTTGSVTAKQLVGDWTLVRDNILYSELDSQKSDVIQNYSGNSYPFYKYYRIKLIDDAITEWIEVSSTGTDLSFKTEMTLEKDNLISLDTKEVVGTILHYDKDHTWDNLRIKWAPNSKFNSNDAPVISTYMN